VTTGGATSITSPFGVFMVRASALVLDVGCAPTYRIAAVATLVDDARPGVAEAALAAIGSIGGAAAASLLLSSCEEPRTRSTRPRRGRPT
jgi:hypothetical protein